MSNASPATDIFSAWQRPPTVPEPAPQEVTWKSVADETAKSIAVAEQLWGVSSAPLFSCAKLPFKAYNCDSSCAYDTVQGRSGEALADLDGGRTLVAFDGLYFFIVANAGYDFFGFVHRDDYYNHTVDL